MMKGVTVYLSARQKYHWVGDDQGLDFLGVSEGFNDVSEFGGMINNGFTGE